MTRDQIICKNFTSHYCSFFTKNLVKVFRQLVKQILFLQVRKITTSIKTLVEKNVSVMC